MPDDKMSTIAMSKKGQSRRDFLTGRSDREPDHIASLVVQAWPERMPQVEAELASLPGVETHGSNGAGKLIVTVESRSDAAMIETITLIETAQGVVTASLVYHHAEELSDDS